MKNNRKLSFLFISLLVFTFVIINLKWSKGFDDINKCLVKYKYEWGKAGSLCKESSKSYSVYFRNECYKKIDAKCAVQETDNRWKTFTRLNMGYNDTLCGYACSGTGKYLVYVKSTTDKSIILPSDDEIQILGNPSQK